jgi:membrane protein DedA with SNARE-associated domain
MGKGIVFMGVAFELVALCVGGYLLGETIDEKMGWKNWASTYLVLILLIGWFVHLIYLLRRFEKENDEEAQGPKA